MGILNFLKGEKKMTVEPMYLMAKIKLLVENIETQKLEILLI